MGMRLFRPLRTRKGFFVLTAFFCVNYSAMAGEFEVSGSHNFVRSPGTPETQVVDFSAPVAGTHYVLRIYNGENAEDLVTSAEVSLNGVEYFQPSDFKKSASYLDTTPIHLELQNSLYVILNGKPGSGLAAEVIGIDNVVPTIDATISPPANAQGWHGADPAIIFSCHDALSGIETCSDGITVSTEGELQEFTGQALDRAGNQAEVSALVSLDKTQPQISSQISPSANNFGWHNQTVTISYSCTDALSGISACPPSVEVASEGEGQLTAAIATDIASNSIEIDDLLNIDTTAPTITATIVPQPNAVGWHNSPVTVSYTCADTLSGINTCAEPQTYSGDGAKQVINGSATDKSGNSASVSTTFNLDTTRPEISFISPASGTLVSDQQPAIQLLISDNIEVDSDSLSIQVAGTEISNCSIANGRVNCALSQPLPRDSKIILFASVSDVAGNVSQATVTTAVDTDQDSIADYLDQCAESPLAQGVDARGCALSQLDSDQDGIDDAAEISAGTDPNDSSSYPVLEIDTFSASPSAIGKSGQQVELRWKVTGASSLKITSDINEEIVENLPSEGALPVNPNFTTGYILTVFGPGGELSEKLVVNLDQSPPPALWSAPSIPVQEQIATSLAIGGDGSAYVGAFDGNFYKVTSSGAVAWALKDIGLVMGKAAINGSQIIMGANVGGSGHEENLGRVYALNPDKSISWKFDTKGAVVASPVLDIENNRVYVATYTGAIYALGLLSGNQIWQYELPGDQEIVGRPALSGDKLIVHAKSEGVFALSTQANLEDDRVLWVRQFSQSN